MRLTSTSIKDGHPIHERYALGVADPEQHIKLGQNLSPQISWENLPEGTASLVLICHDPDAPSKPDDVNQEGREVPGDLARVDFYHWVLVDIDPKLEELREAEFSQGVTPHGKKGPDAPRNCRQGLNNYTEWFTGDSEMEGHYYGYDGPCPPWNDSITHRYIFTLYALDIPRCPVEGSFGALEVLKAIKGHILAKDSITCTYSLNPRFKQ